jgi:hypothetical protein
VDDDPIHIGILLVCQWVQTRRTFVRVCGVVRDVVLMSFRVDDSYVYGARFGVCLVLVAYRKLGSYGGHCRMRVCLIAPHIWVVFLIILFQKLQFSRRIRIRRGLLCKPL